MSVRLILLRGLPGSGKSTKARELLKTLKAQHLNVVHLEADMYFEDTQGNYHFQGDKLADAHRWCQLATRNALKNGDSVIVANTFVRRWEIEPYQQMAEEFSADLEIITCRGEYPNCHGVPFATIEQMRKGWEEFDVC